MTIGVGTDILRIERIRNVLEDDSTSFIKKTYTVRECEQAELRPNPLMYYAARFAAKEAVFKSLGIDGSFINLNEIEILNNELGQPFVALYGKIKSTAEKKGVSHINISLSYETDYALAFAIAEK